MVHNLSLIHLMLGAGAAACFYLVVRELRRTYVSQWRLFAPGLAALFVAIVMFLTQIIAGQPRWSFAAAAAIGLLIGGVRGMMIPLKHDLYRPQILISRNAKLSLLAVSVGVAVCVALEIVGAFFSPGFEKLRYWAALSAVVCASAILARATALTVRLRQHHN